MSTTPTGSSPTYYLASEGHKWQFYGAVYKKLLSKSEWREISIKSNKFDLLLADRGKINYSHLSLYKLQTINYFRSFEEITMKSLMARNIKDYSIQNSIDISFLPISFILIPISTDHSNELELNNRSNFINYNTINPGIWIAKSTHGAKGDNIKISTNPFELINYIDSFYIFDKKNPSWLVQKYIENPFLYKSIKFDIRCWVLLLDDYYIYLYQEGVCRLASLPYDNSKFDTHSHLTNHCLQVNSETYGNLYPTNEMLFKDLSQYLNETTSFTMSDVLNQIENIAITSLLSVKETIGGKLNYNRFQLFGYDLLIDIDGKVWLLEINATPAVTEELLNDLVEDFIDIAIEPSFPTISKPINYKENKFKKIYPKIN